MASGVTRLLPWVAAAIVVVGLIAGAAVLAVLVSASRGSDTLSLNCGGPAIGKSVIADNITFHQHTLGKVSTLVRGSPDESLFNSVSTVLGGSDLVYTFSVRPGSNVDVVAKFVELDESAKSGMRVLRVLVNGEQLRDGLDVFDTRGGVGRPYEATQSVTAKSGAIEVRVHPLQGDAMIAGIEVVARGGVLAGGPLFDDTQGNVPVSSVSPSYSAGAMIPSAQPTSVQPTNTPATNAVPAVSAQPAPPPSTAAPSEPPTAVGPKLEGSGSWHTLVRAGDVDLSARHEGCAVMVEGKVYLIGGRGIRPVSVLDTKTSIWTNLKNSPDEMNHMQCVAVGNKIYFPGAWYGAYPFEKDHAVTWVYDTTNDSWSEEPALPESRRRGGGAAVLHNGAIYLSHGNQGGHGEHATTLGWLDRYDLATKRWTALATAPDARDHVHGAVVDGRLCVAGGRDGGVKDFWDTPVTPVNCYNFESNTWTRGKPIPVGRGGAGTAATCQGLLMVAGGEGRPDGAYTRVDLYDAANDRWLPHVDLKRKRHGSGLAVADCSCGNIYLPSGSGNLGGGPELTSTEVWSPDGVVRQC